MMDKTIIKSLYWWVEQSLIKCLILITTLGYKLDNILAPNTCNKLGREGIWHRQHYNDLLSWGKHGCHSTYYDGGSWHCRGGQDDETCSLVVSLTLNFRYRYSICQVGMSIYQLQQAGGYCQGRPEEPPVRLQINSIPRLPLTLQPMNTSKIIQGCLDIIKCWILGPYGGRECLGGDGCPVLESFQSNIISTKSKCV